MPTKTTTARTTLDKKLVTLAKRRKSGTINADDAQKILDRMNYRGYRAIVGAVLNRNGSFTQVGYTKSTIPSNRHRAIGEWRLRANV